MEIARTSLWGFYCRKGASWTQITTDWEYQCGLKIIKSWRFYLSKQKRSTIGQAIWTLFSCYLFQITFISTQLSTIKWRVVSNHLSKVTHMIPSLPKLTWTLSISFLIVWKTTPAICTYRLKQVPTPHLAHFFFSFDLFQCPEKPQNPGGKVEMK